jgi:hypothetical protein
MILEFDKYTRGMASPFHAIFAIKAFGFYSIIFLNLHDTKNRLTCPNLDFVENRRGVP